MSSSKRWDSVSDSSSAVGVEEGEIGVLIELNFLKNVEFWVRVVVDDDYIVFEEEDRRLVRNCLGVRQSVEVSGVGEAVELTIEVEFLPLHRL